jgi:hypothetical protein
MDINQYEKDHYDERLDDLNQWCDNGELYLKCKKNIVHKVPTKEAIWQISLFENELYKVDCIVDDYGHPHAYLTDFGDQICISLDDDDSDFELVVIEQSNIKDFDDALLRVSDTVAKTCKTFSDLVTTYLKVHGNSDV